jgi:hypothetical protein
MTIWRLSSVQLFLEKRLDLVWYEQKSNDRSFTIGWLGVPRWRREPGLVCHISDLELETWCRLASWFLQGFFGFYKVGVREKWWSYGFFQNLLLRSSPWLYTSRCATLQFNSWFMKVCWSMWLQSGLQTNGDWRQCLLERYFIFLPHWSHWSKSNRFYCVWKANFVTCLIHFVLLVKWSNLARGLKVDLQ